MSDDLRQTIVRVAARELSAGAALCPDRADTLARRIADRAIEAVAERPMVTTRTPGDTAAPVSYLVQLTFDEPDDDLGILRMLADDACELVESHWHVNAKVVNGFNRLIAIAREILNEVYPADVFGTADDSDSDESDPGVRLVRALRACDEAMREKGGQA